MREKKVLRRRATPKILTLPNGTTFTAEYERIRIYESESESSNMDESTNKHPCKKCSTNKTKKKKQGYTFFRKRGKN